MQESGLQTFFARCIIPACRGPRVADYSSQGKLVKERLTRWRGNVFGELWMEAVKLSKCQPRGRKKVSEEKKQELENTDRAMGLVQEGGPVLQGPPGPGIAQQQLLRCE